MFCGAFFVFPQGIVRMAVLIVMAAVFAVYAVSVLWDLYRTYKRAIRTVDNFHSEDIAVYLNWMSTFSYWGIFFTALLGVLTFLPEEYVYLWIISAIPLYIYVFWCYMGYLLFYEQVEEVLDMDEPTADEVKSARSVYYGDAGVKLEGWIAAKGFTKQGITISQLT